MLTWLDSRAAALGLSADARRRLAVVAEELVLNSVLHGYAGCGDGWVAVALRSDGEHAELLVEDGAPEFDPFAAPVEVAATGDASARPVGRLGIALVVAMSSTRSYCRDGDCNRVLVQLPRT